MRHRSEDVLGGIMGARIPVPLDTAEERDALIAELLRLLG
jgi:hypothetical protein